MNVSQILKRVAWRRVLPIAQILLAVALLAMGRANEDAFYAELKSRRPASPPGEMVIQFDPPIVWDHGDPMISLAIAMNLPAVVLSLPVLYIFGDLKSTPAFVLTIAVFLVCVHLLWYWIGRGLDRRLGSLRRPPSRRRSRVLTTARWAGFLGCIGLAILGCYEVATAIFFFVRIFAVGFVVWGTAFAVYLGRMVFHQRDEPSST